MLGVYRIPCVFDCPLCVFMLVTFLSVCFAYRFVLQLDAGVCVLSAEKWTYGTELITAGFVFMSLATKYDTSIDRTCSLMQHIVLVVCNLAVPNMPAICA